MPDSTRKKTTRSQDEKKTKKPLKLVFIHLDLGIGGAEQLILQLANAGKELGHSIDLVTTRCDADHCFAAVAPGGALYNNLHIYGNWIPSQIVGMATAMLSTIRICYLTILVCWYHSDADVCVVDVLPTSLPILYWCLPTAATFFYCHFPDQLLLRNNGGRKGLFQQIYRFLLDFMEEMTMSMADLIVVNSKFTRKIVGKTFPSLYEESKDADSTNNQSALEEQIPILYPALDTKASASSEIVVKNHLSPIVSLNRFERKKNIKLLIYAYDYLKNVHPDVELPPLIIAGGYDRQNAENVEYRGELQKIVDEELQLPVDFRPDISDQERAKLFQTALAVVYTPHQEHFGIVPLEAMYAGTPVVAVKSGGPMETIIDGKTGFLREPSPRAFGDALLQFIQNPTIAMSMGKAGKQHVQTNFGTERLAQEFQSLLNKCQERQKTFRPHYALWSQVGHYVVDIIYAVLVALFLTVTLHKTGILQENESILGGIKRTWNEEEL